MRLDRTVIIMPPRSRGRRQRTNDKSQAMQDKRICLWNSRLLFLIVAGVLALIIAACETVDHLVVIPPHVPGANFIGSKECAQCHDEIYRDFKTATHARLQAKGPNAINMGCESCHGPGSLHAE